MAYKHLGQTELLGSNRTTPIPIFNNENPYRVTEQALRNALSTRPSQSEYYGSRVLIGNGANKINAEVLNEEHGYLTFGVEGGPGVFDNYFDTILYSDVYVKGVGGYVVNGRDGMTVARYLDCLDDRIAAMELLAEEKFNNLCKGITLEVELGYAPKLEPGLVVHYDEDKQAFKVSGIDMFSAIGGARYAVGVTIDENHAIFGDFTRFTNYLGANKGRLSDFRQYCAETPIGFFIIRNIEARPPILSKCCLYTGETDGFNTYVAFRTNQAQIKNTMDTLNASFGNEQVWLCDPKPHIYSFNNQYMVPDVCYGDADSMLTATYLPIFRVKLNNK